MRDLVHLVAMVKNEAGNIRKTLESVRPFVDGWTVLDTGSTDGTQAIVREAMAGVPGELHEEPFVDYATSRNVALMLDRQAGGGAVFTLFLGGDETLEGGPELRDFLEKNRDAKDGAYCVQMLSVGRSWAYTRVLRTDAEWHYVGEVQERPVSPGGDVRAKLIPGVKVVHAPSDPERKLARLREYDLPTLTKLAEDYEQPAVNRAHAMFFLAETHCLLASEFPRDEIGTPWLLHMMTAMSYYLRYAQLAEDSDDLAHDASKAAYAYFLYFHCADEIGIYQSVELVPRLQSLVQVAPDLLEAKFLLAKHTAQLPKPTAAADGLKLAELVAHQAKLRRDNPSYEVTDVRLEWMALKVAAHCAKHMKIPDRAKKFAERALAAGGPPKVFAEYL